MEFLTFEQIENVGIVTINRPKALNALNTGVLEELLELFTNGIPSDVYAVILTGAGDKSFVAGADIAEMKDKNVVESKAFGNLGNKAFKAIEDFKYPVIAMVNGFALGGGTELALACDFRVASVKAKFGQPEVGLGITPGYGGTQRLPRAVGPAVAKEMIYTAKIIKADEAKAIGLVNHIFEVENLLEETMKIAKTIANNAPVAVAMSKEAINNGLDCDIDTALAFESLAFSTCFATEDQKIAMTSFVNRTEKEIFKNK
ncbi:MAG: enoyl-CoA hydratase-related protein [Clostridia bacterium]